jgi:quercetin dioxygenase-like cupin family protein
VDTLSSRQVLTQGLDGWDDQCLMPNDEMEPFVLAPGGGLSVENPVGGILTFKVMADASGGALTALETIAAPGEGPPLHVHRDEDETIYILEGRFRVKLADELVDSSPGSFVFIPRGTPHTWKNVTDTPARFFATIVPAALGFERFFVLYSELSPHERGAEAFARLAQETQAFEVLGPPLGDSAPS